MYRVLHLADLHLETPLTSAGLPPELGFRYRAALRAALERLLELARQREVQAVTIGGDLYEQAYVLPELAEYLVRQFAALAPRRVIIAPGRSDPFSEDSFYAVVRWPENVTILPRGPLTRVSLAPEITLWGAAAALGHEEDLLAEGPTLAQGVNVLLLHAADKATTRASKEVGLRVSAAEVRRAGFALALLGEAHEGSLTPADKPLLAYPGSPEPLVFAPQRGQHGAVLLSVEEGACQAELIAADHCRLPQVVVEVEGCRSAEEVTERLSLALGAPEAQTAALAVAQVVLQGTPTYDLDVATLPRQWGSDTSLCYVARFPFGYDLAELAQEPTVRGQLVRQFQARLQGAPHTPEHPATLHALSLALRALEGKELRPCEAD
jgi:DNA repair exonuclease SbcCD nuclease subunit